MNKTGFHYLHPLLIALLLSFSLFSCNQQTPGAENKEPPDEVEAVREEVMAIHDEIMPRIGTLMSLKKQLKAKAAQLDTADAGNNTQPEALLGTIKELEEADEAMMQWMRTYDEPDQTVGKAKALEYLELKKEEIYMVKEKMEASETAARAML